LLRSRRQGERRNEDVQVDKKTLYYRRDPIGGKKETRNTVQHIRVTDLLRGGLKKAFMKTDYILGPLSDGGVRGSVKTSNTWAELPCGFKTK